MKKKFILLIIYLVFFTNNVFPGMNEDTNSKKHFAYLEQRLKEKRSLKEYTEKEIQNKKNNITVKSIIITTMKEQLKKIKESEEALIIEYEKAAAAKAEKGKEEAEEEIKKVKKSNQKSKKRSRRRNKAIYSKQYK